MGGGWATSGGAIDTFETLNGEGNHKGCPYKDTLFHRKAPRADLDGSGRGSHESCPFRVRVQARSGLVS